MGYLEWLGAIRFVNSDGDFVHGRRARLSTQHLLAERRKARETRKLAALSKRSHNNRQIKHVYNECVLLLPDCEGEVFGRMVPLHLDQVTPALSDQHEGLRVKDL